MERWQGKVAVVTGASAGIGAAVCVTLANAGLKVVGLARRVEIVEKLKAEVKGSGSIHAKRCDVSHVEDINAVFDWIENTFGGVDALVNNAGIFISGHITEFDNTPISDEDVQKMYNTNVTGLVICTRRAITSMKKRGFDGHIVNINSLAGHYVPFSARFNVYSSTKHAVSAFTDALVHELAELHNNIKVTSLSPGLVRTEMTEDVLNQYKAVPALEAQHIADAVLYVISTPPIVNITELTITPTSGVRM